MAELTCTDLGARQGLKPLQRAKAILLGWPVRLIGASVTTLLLSQQPARALTYNLVDVNVTYTIPRLLLPPVNYSASITGSFDYSGGSSQGLVQLDPGTVNIFFDSTPNFFGIINLDQPFNFGWVFNNGADSFLFFNNENDSLLDCDPTLTFGEPCLRLNISNALTETPFESRTLDSGTDAAGNYSKIGLLSLELTGSMTANVIQAVPSPFSALLFAPLLPLLRYRRRFRYAAQHAAQTNAIIKSGGSLLRKRVEAEDFSEPRP